MPSFAKPSSVACLLFACAFVAACEWKQGQPANQTDTPNAATAPVDNAAETSLLPQPPMDRAALLQAVASARSAAAAGADDSAAQQPLDGKAFELRIRFGCSGPDSTTPGPLGWTLDKDGGVLRVHAAPDISKADPVVAGMALQDIDAVEGLWIARPWLFQATCPAQPAPAPAGPAETATPAAAPPVKQSSQPQLPPEGARTGIAQFFTQSDSRTAQRGDRPYEAVKKLDDGASVGSQGFDLVLSGRLRALDGGRVVRCVARGPDAPPACIISATFDHVWIEDAASKDRIADWSSS